MRTFSLLGLSAILLFSLLLGGCNRLTEDWNDPAWIAHRASLGDERAYAEFSRLSLEQKQSIVPQMIEVYNDGLRRDRALAALVDAEDRRAREVFLSALQSSVDRDAAVAASGLAAIGDTASSTAIAQRLSSVTSPEVYQRFFEALQDLPTPQVAEVVSGILLRQAGRIGGVSTVRSGCRMLSEVEDVSDEVGAALVFSMVNFVPQPYDDPLDSCELAVLRHGDDMVPALAEMLRGENSRINDHLRNLQYPLVTGQVRAARALGRMKSDAAVAAVTQWYSTSNPVPVADMQDLPLAVQSEWYSTFGQVFEYAVAPLYLRASDEDRAVLRSLEAPGEGTRLQNFVQWLQLSDGAEVGFRQSIHDAMSRVGGEEELTLLRERATRGTTGRGGIRTDVMMRLNALHYLGRHARPDQMDMYQAILDAQPEAHRLQFRPLRAYFAVAELCGTNVECLGDMTRNPEAVLQQEDVAALLESIEDAEANAAMRRGFETSARLAGVWQLALVHGDNDDALNQLVGRLDSSDLPLRLTVIDALLTVRRLPAGAAESIREIIADEIEVRGVPNMREVRHGLRVLLHVAG